MSQAELDELEEAITEEIEEILAICARNDGADGLAGLADIQLPSTVLHHAAQAAAQVLMAFERGYRMGT